MDYIIVSIYIIALTFIFVFSISQLQLTLVYLKNKRKPKSETPAAPKEWPKVTVQLPVYNEQYVVARLIDAVCAFDYPTDHLDIQLLDDSDDDTTAIIAERIEHYRAQGIDIALIRRPERIGFKAGALDYGLRTAKGEFIAVFDADFLPGPDFLKKAVPHFQSNTAVVQGRWGHINKDYSLLTNLQAFGLDAHFTIEQVGRSTSGSFINFNGTAGIWRKEAISDAGGWSADTLTEDLDLSYRAQLRGWEFAYVEDLVAPAELPVIMQSVKSQQFRWNKGGAENARKHVRAMLSGTRSFGTKWHAFFHLFNSSIFIAILVAALMSVPVLFVLAKTPAFDFLAHLGMVFFIGFFSIGFFYWVAYQSLNKQASSWSFMKIFMLFIVVSMGLSWHNAMAVAQGLLGKRSAFIRTPKFNITDKTDNWRHNLYVMGKLKHSFWIEGAMILYFAFGVYMAWTYQKFMLLPFHLMLCLGFSIVFVYSMLPYYARSTKRK